VKRIVAAVLALCAGGAALLGAGGGTSGYRVDAIFDNTAALIPGQDVKIAGARVGIVKDVSLTRDRRARVEMEVGERFAPFRSDANCAIRPQSLIGEKFVQCDPGSPRGGPLAPDDSGTPTVPLDRTSSPVDLDLVFAAFRRPFRERFALLVNELGTGLAGRPGDLSEAIRRANPALKEANDVLRILDRDRDVLGRLVERSDQVLAEVAGADRELASFIERADSAAQAVAERRDGLEEAIRRLPPLLAEAEPAARGFAAFAHGSVPVVRELRQAAPALRQLFADFDPLADAARPALVRLAEMSRVGRRAVRASRPVARRLRPVARALVPVTDIGTELLSSVQSSGAVEGLQRFVYYASAAVARFDRVSHILPSYQLAGSCQSYATEPAEGCSAHFGEPPAAPQAAARRRSRRRAARAPRRAVEPARPTPAPPAPPAPVEPARPPALPEVDVPVLPLLDFLLGA
jgi:virulence factor Mce-like protein